MRVDISQAGHVPSGKSLPRKTAYKPSEIEEEFHDVQKTYFKYAGSLAGILGVVLAGGTLQKGAEFPSKMLRFLGDTFGAVAAVAIPYVLFKNEKNDLNRRNNGKESGTGESQNNLNELLYRFVSTGFIPYVYESLIDPSKIMRSASSKITTLINIPNMLFTGLTFGLGNINSIIAWGLKTQEQFGLDKKASELSNLDENSSEAETLRNEVEVLQKRKASYDKLYSSTKRFVTIGSIALPAMNGLRRFSESFDMFTGAIDTEDFFRKPFVSLSRVLNLFVGLPEVFAKGFDSIARIAQEREHLLPALPTSLQGFVENYGKKFDAQVTSDKGNIIKTSRNLAEMIFHTFSPISQLAFIAPVLDQPAFNEEAQAKGGITAGLDTFMGIAGKGLLYTFTLPYIFISRLPQAVSQISYFGRYFYGKAKGENKTATTDAINTMQDSIANHGLIKLFSDKVKSIIQTHLVEDYYEHDHSYGFPSFEEIQARTSFDQIKECFKDDLDRGSELSFEKRAEIVNFGIEFIKRSALRADQELDTTELSKIRELVNKKIDQAINPEKLQKPERKPIKFLGANFIANFLRPFDFSSRLNALSNKSPYHRMETAYTIDEVSAFEMSEFLIVLSECGASGLHNMVNLVQGIPVRNYNN